jgi:hypothetical protein
MRYVIMLLAAGILIFGSQAYAAVVHVSNEAEADYVVTITGNKAALGRTVSTDLGKATVPKDEEKDITITDDIAVSGWSVTMPNNSLILMSGTVTASTAGQDHTLTITQEDNKVDAYWDK